jgi:hypothetical protein
MILSSEFSIGFKSIELPITPISVIKVKIINNPSPGILKPIRSVRYCISSPSTNTKETQIAYMVIANGEISRSPWKKYRISLFMVLY